MQTELSLLIYKNYPDKICHQPSFDNYIFDEINVIPKHYNVQQKIIFSYNYYRCDK